MRRDARERRPRFQDLQNFLKYRRASSPLSWSSRWQQRRTRQHPSLHQQEQERTLPFSSSSQTFNSVLLRK